MRRLLFAALVLVTLVAVAPASAAPVPFALRWSANVNGRIAMASNANVTCPVTDPACIQAQQGLGSLLNNNSFNSMSVVDVDGDPATPNSSAATLGLPPGATVLFAGLYWGFSATPPTRPASTMLLKADGDAYQTITAATFGTAGTKSNGGFADVTAYVQAHGATTYYGASIPVQTTSATTAASDSWAGWTLVVAYRDATATPHNLSIFDGFLQATSSNPLVSTTVSGFTAPPTGTVETRAGLIGYDGDRTAAGDYVRINGVNVTNTLNPANNVFNSTVSTDDQNVVTRSPAYTNTLGVDADLIQANGTIPNAATSATLQATTNLETIDVQALTLETALYAPALQYAKTVTDLNGGDVQPGDVLEYVITGSNSGSDSARSVVLTDDVPANTTYVADSAKAVNGKALESGGTVTAYLGTGATAKSGGTLAVGATASLTFRVRITESITAPTGIANIARGTAVATTLGTTLESDSNPAEVTVVPLPAPPLEITLDPSTPSPTPGETVEVPATIANTSDDTTIRRVQLCVDAPPAIEVDGVTTSAATGEDCSRPVAIRPGAERTITVELTPKAGTSGHRIRVRIAAKARGFRPVRRTLTLRVVRAHRPEPVTG